MLNVSGDSRIQRTSFERSRGEGRKVRRPVDETLSRVPYRCLSFRSSISVALNRNSITRESTTIRSDSPSGQYRAG